VSDQENREKKELFSIVVIIWSSDPLHVDWLRFSQLATGLNQQSSDTFFALKGILSDEKLVVVVMASRRRTKEKGAHPKKKKTDNYLQSMSRKIIKRVKSL
jgi:hypothetical protein